MVSKRIIFCVISFVIIISLICCKSNGKIINKELYGKLTRTELGMWDYNSINDNGKYRYILDFFGNKYFYSNNNKILFIHFIENNDKNSIFEYIHYVWREGSFIIENNNIIITFRKVRGSKYNRPNFGDELLIENMVVILEITEISDDKIKIKQISGINIFEEHKENEEIEFIAIKKEYD